MSGPVVGGGAAGRRVEAAVPSRRGVVLPPRDDAPHARRLPPSLLLTASRLCVVNIEAPLLNCKGSNHFPRPRLRDIESWRPDVKKR